MSPVRRPLEQRVDRNGIEVRLTAREFAVLLALTRRAGRVVRKETLMREVWRDTLDNANNVEVHISALRRKLESTGAPLIRTVHGTGYLLATTSKLDDARDRSAERIRRAHERAHR